MANEILDASTGTAIWAFNQFRQDALTQLLNDLLAVERTGISEDICSQVQTALKAISNQASSIPDGTFFSHAIWTEIDDFKDVYIRWNDVNGNDPKAIKARDSVLKQLRKKRHKIAKKTRKHQYVLSNELDLQVVDNMYKAFNDLVSAVPDIFKCMAQAIIRYDKKKAKMSKRKKNR